MFTLSCLDLEDKKERELEQKRQEIQRALKALEDGDDAPVIDTKKVVFYISPFHRSQQS